MSIYRKSDIPAHLLRFFEPAEIGLEETPEQYIANMVQVFALVRDMLSDDGVLWLNIGDSYSNNRGSQPEPTNTRNKNGHVSGGRVPVGLKPKDMIGIPWMLAFALRADGWYLRQDIIWHKPNPMPESVRDRCTKAHEYIFMLTKSQNYYFDIDANQEEAICGSGGGEKPRESVKRGDFNGKSNDLPGREAFRAVRETRNRRSVWTVATVPYAGAHFAVFPPELIEPCILNSSRAGDIVLDPFFGSGTTGEVAQRLGRKWIGCEINQEYESLQKQRTQQQSLELI